MMEVGDENTWFTECLRIIQHSAHNDELKDRYIYNLTVLLCIKQETNVLRTVKSQQWIKLLNNIISNLQSFDKKTLITIPFCNIFGYNISTLINSFSFSLAILNELLLEKFKNMEVIEYINAHPDEKVVYVCDSHPSDHSSFINEGGIWPSHCVQGTRGAEIHKSFYTDVINPSNRPDENRNIFRKGRTRNEEQYSGFESVNINEVLLKDCVGKDLIISGIATEYCVKNTLLEFLNAGSNIELLVNGLGYVDKNGHVETLKELENKVTFIE